MIIDTASVGPCGIAADLTILDNGRDPAFNVPRHHPAAGTIGGIVDNPASVKPEIRLLGGQINSAAFFRSVVLADFCLVIQIGAAKDGTAVVCCVFGDFSIVIEVGSTIDTAAIAARRVAGDYCIIVQISSTTDAAAVAGLVAADLNVVIHSGSAVNAATIAAYRRVSGDLEVIFDNGFATGDAGAMSTRRSACPVASYSTSGEHHALSGSSGVNIDAAAEAVRTRTGRLYRVVRDETAVHHESSSIPETNPAAVAGCQFGGHIVGDRETVFHHNIAGATRVQTAAAGCAGVSGDGAVKKTDLCIVPHINAAAIAFPRVSNQLVVID